jgi:transcription elongation factor GreA
MSENDYFLTAEAAEKIQSDLSELTGPKRVDLANRLREAISQGDLSENADYIAAKEEQAFLEGKIQEYESLLRKATIIDEKPVDGAIGIGSTVVVKLDDGDPETYHIVGMKEADPHLRKISNDSPIGKSLMGLRVGELATAETPGGAMQLKVIEIQ